MSLLFAATWCTGTCHERSVLGDLANSQARGIESPRGFANVDTFFTVNSVLTAPLFILPRTLGAVFCCIQRLLAIDLEVLLDYRLDLCDYARSANAGVWASLRLQYEFDKRKAYPRHSG